MQVTALVCICVNSLLSMFSLLRRKGANGGGGAGQRTGEGGEQLRQPFKKKAEPDQEPIM